MNISEKLTKIRNALKAIKQAIINKGQTPSGDITTYPDAIGNISSGTKIKNQDKTITSNGSYTADEGYTGLGTVTVNVESSGETTLIGREITEDGVLQYPSTNFTFSLPSSIKSIGTNALYSTFANCKTLTSVNLSNLIDIKNTSMQYVFHNCTNLTSVDLSSVKSIGTYGMYNAFNNCTNLTSVDLSSVKKVGSNSLANGFYYCRNLTSVNLNSLSNMTSGDISKAFSGSGINELNFPALTSKSFGKNTTQFANMLLGVSNCTVHFPSNLSSVIGTWSDVTKGFGGNSTQILFDLPATS